MNKVIHLFERFLIARKDFEFYLDKSSAMKANKAQSEWLRCLNEKKLPV